VVIGLREFITLPAAQTKNPVVVEINRVRWAFVRFILFLFALFSTLLLQSCAAPLVSAASSVGTAAGSAAAASPVTAVSVTSTVTTGRSPLEHATSAATKKDCSVFSAKAICQEIIIPSISDQSELIIGEADRAGAVIEIIEVRPSK
jgi:hypothetical protein